MSTQSYDLEYMRARALHNDRRGNIAAVEELDTQHSPLVTLSGEVDNNSCARVGEVLYELYESGYPAPRMDMAGVSSMDKDGLSAVLYWCQQYKRGDNPFEVVSVNPLVRQVFETMGHKQVIDKSEDRTMPAFDQPICQPITDCTAVAGNLELKSFSIKARLDSCKLVRDTITQAMAGMAFTNEERCDVKLAVGEAITNAIRHGSKERPWETVTVRCLATTSRLVVEISDNGPGFDLVEVLATPVDPAAAEGGMGIRCMQHVMDEVQFDFSLGTTVRLVKYASNRS